MVRRVEKHFEEKFSHAFLDDPLHLAGVAGALTEDRFSNYISLIGGRRGSELINRHGVRNADYIIEGLRCVVELKSLQKDLTDNDTFCTKVRSALDEGLRLGEASELTDRRVASILRSYIKDIVRSANDQIKQTKHELRYHNFAGIVVVINSSFESLSIQAAEKCFESIINSDTQYRSINGLIYIEDMFDDSGIARIGVCINGNKRTTASTSRALTSLVRGLFLFREVPELWEQNDNAGHIVFEYPANTRFTVAEINAFICRCESVGASHTRWAS